ncbi:probable serine/threonine-protein kinase DDB_G0280717 [Actinia tenebrosa]|uniref:Probable serine/threonine-protein kinase DDB_G0280717 n=1 Tax=Actinia tenebrosa TaxID=6105 RepID=A0A6P8HLB2_ACTTE|nr:probable serine/threonine-protein kinase DDB_G0280717 [Actinia tenebrosa]
MNHKNRRKAKRQRWLQRKREKEAEERRKDRERRIEERAEQLIAMRANDSKVLEEPHAPEPPKKKLRLPTKDVAVKEINSNHIVRTKKHLGSGSYGSCFLAFYRGITVVVKELQIHSSDQETKEDAKKRTHNELLNEANIITKLGDHPGLPLLFGICSKSTPYRLVLQFHGNGCDSLTLLRALHSKLVAKKREWDAIMIKTAEALQHIHSVGFLHNDLKSNNVLLDKRGTVLTPVIIDFGKSRPISNPMGPKTLSLEEQVRYKKKYPHIAPEIVEGRAGQSVASDIFSFAKIVEQIYLKCKFEELPHLVTLCLSPSVEARPRCAELY